MVIITKYVECFIFGGHQSGRIAGHQDGRMGPMVVGMWYHADACSSLSLWFSMDVFVLIVAVSS